MCGTLSVCPTGVYLRVSGMAGVSIKILIKKRNQPQCCFPLPPRCTICPGFNHAAIRLAPSARLRSALVMSKMTSW